MTVDEALDVADDRSQLDPEECMEGDAAVVVLAAAIERVLAECDRIEQHIAANVPHLEPTAGTMSVGKIRALLRGPSS